MYLFKFLNYLRDERNYSNHTIIAYQKDIEQFYLYLCLSDDENVLDALSVVNVRSWMMELIKVNNSATTVRRKLSSLRVYSRFLYKEGLIASEKLSSLTGPKTEKKLPIFVRESNMTELLDGDFFESGFEGSRNRLIVDMLYSTGIRLAELIGLDFDDVDLDRMQIKVLGKGNKERIIPFGCSLQKRMFVYLEDRNVELGDLNKAFFVNKGGRRVSRSFVYSLVNTKLQEISTLTKRSPHVLRHSFATNMLNNGADLQVIKEVLGHTSLAATEIYTHTTFKELKKVYKQAHPRA